MQESNSVEPMEPVKAGREDAEAKERVFRTEMYDRVLARATRMDRMEAMRHFLEGPRLSAVGVVEVAEELDSTPHWIITGERDPWEVKFSRCDDADGRKYNQSL